MPIQVIPSTTSICRADIENVSGTRHPTGTTIVAIQPTLCTRIIKAAVDSPPRDTFIEAVVSAEPEQSGRDTALLVEAR